MSREKILRQVRLIIKEKLPQAKIILFGSWAKNTADPSSDLDIGILDSEKIQSQILNKIKDEIEQIPTLRKIDIVDLNHTSQNFRENVLKYGKKL